MRMSPGALAAWANGRAPLAANAPRRARRRVLAANPGQAAPPKTSGRVGENAPWRDWGSIGCRLMLNRVSINAQSGGD